MPNTPLRGHHHSYVLSWIFPVIWLYLPLLMSTILTLVLSHSAFKMLLAGTTASILARFRIIVVNFRNISTHLLYVLILAILDVSALATGNRNIERV